MECCAFTKATKAFADKPFEDAFIRHCQWTPNAARPYVVNASAELVDRLHTEGKTIKGVTLTAVGFYGPQGRVLRLPLAMPGINDRITDRYDGYKVTNYEMESAAVTGLCNPAGTPCRYHLPDHRQPDERGCFADYHGHMGKLIKYTLNQLTK